MQVVFFGSEFGKRLRPVTYTRPSFTIRCGGTTLRKLVKLMFKPNGIHIVVRPFLRKVTEEIIPRPKTVADELLFLNGQIIPDVRVVTKIQKLVAAGKSFCIKDGGEVIVAYISRKALGISSTQITKLSIDEVQDFLRSLKLKPITSVVIPRFKNLWDVMVANTQILPYNLPILAQALTQIKPGVFVGKGVEIASTAVLDSSKGLIVIDDKTRVSDYAILRGPVFIGRQCVINSFAEITDGSTIGNVCKVGGEVEASVFQGWSNKQHDGFLGHSYVGEWVNLGAGTTNSDLKSTYGEIAMQGQPTGQQFLGCVIGSYTKTAIGTMIYTGKVVGVNSQLFGAVVQDVPSFTNAGSLVARSVSLPVEQAIKMQRAMFARRKITARAHHRQLLQDVFELTVEERAAAGVTTGSLLLAKTV
jgi:UDP-N-acetylglucosamine diphosphorylase/glucosamine-1-phosphate N-acetyltransferase